MSKIANVVASVAAMAVLAARVSVAADMVLYNFPYTNSYAWQSDVPYMAQTFTTGPAALNLKSLEIWYRNASEDNMYSLEGHLDIKLYATDASFKPTGSALLTFTNNLYIGEWGDCAPGAGNGLKCTNLNYALAANTTYAIVFHVGDSPTIGWKYNSVGTPSSDVSPTPTFYNWYSYTGSTWSDADPTNGFCMIVLATPEPAAGLLIAAGGLVVALRARRQD